MTLDLNLMRDRVAGPSGPMLEQRDEMLAVIQVARTARLLRAATAAMADDRVLDDLENDLEAALDVLDSMSDYHKEGR